MTVSTTDSVIEYVSGGPAFPIPYRFLKDADIEAVLVKQDGTSETLALGTQYTVVGANTQSGGTLTSAYAATFLAAPGATLSISRVMDATQPTDLRNQGRFLAETHETVFDRLTMLIQQGLALFRRALMMPIGKNYYDAMGRQIKNLGAPSVSTDATTKGYVDDLDSGSRSYTDSLFSRTIRGPEPISQMVSATARANKVLGFDNQGNPIAVLPASGSGTELAVDLANKTVVGKGSGMVGHMGRTVYDALRDWVSVASYGGQATGDGTAAFNAAAAAAGPGGQVYIPFPTYTVNNAEANGCRVLGSNTTLTGVIRNHAGTFGIIVGGHAQDRLRIQLPEASEHAPLFVYRQNSEKYFVMVRKQGGGKGGAIFEMLHNQTTLSSSVGVNAEFLRVCRVHNCTGIYGWQSGPSSETGTWKPYTLTDEEAGHLGDNLQRPVTSRRSTSSGSSATYQITVPRSGRFNVALLGSSASPSTVEIRVDGDLVKTVNPQLFNRFIYAVQCEATPGARSVTVTGVGLGTVYLIGMNFHSMQEAVPGSFYNNWAAYRNPAMTHFILSEGAHDYAIFDRTSQLWAGSYHGGETAREPRQFLLDNVPNDMADTQVACAASLVIRQKTKIDWSGYGGGIIWSNSETRFAASQVELRASFINEVGSSPRIQRFHTGMNGVNEIFTDMVFPREGTIGDDEIDLGQTSKLVMQHPPSRAAVITDVNLHPDIESDRGGMFIQPATGAYKKVYYPWVMNGTRIFANLSFTCRRTFR